MDTQQQLFGLMAVAEEHQKAVKSALDGLTAERAALAKERAAVAQAAASVAGVVVEVRKAAAEAVGTSVRQSLAGAADAAAKALGEASRPIVGQLSGVVQAAGEAEGKLSGAVAAFGWRWAMLAGGAAAGGIVAVLLAAWLAVWWQRNQVESLSEQKAALLGEVAQLQASAEDWAKRGGRAKLEKCGDQGRLCVRIDKSSGYGKDGDYYVLRGY
ncbi:MAG: hypothetical protein RI920_185 [Pseudomonadota bacterium]|jgi:hypothetical protein